MRCWPGFEGSTVVDLTVALSEELPCAWPTHMPFQRKLYNYFADNPNQNQPTWGFAVRTTPRF